MMPYTKLQLSEYRRTNIEMWNAREKCKETLNMIIQQNFPPVIAERHSIELRVRSKYARNRPPFGEIHIRACGARWRLHSVGNYGPYNNGILRSAKQSFYASVRWTRDLGTVKSWNSLDRRVVSSCENAVVVRASFGKVPPVNRVYLSIPRRDV